MSIKGTKTEQNLLKSFAGESQARNRYTYYAGQARKEGFVQIAMQFEETANQEKEHAKRFFKYLEGGDLEITATYPAGKICTTLENLQASIHGENEEHSALYPSFAETARQEGFSEIAKLFDFVSIAEMRHEKQFKHFLSLLENGTMFKRNSNVTWRCLNCGYTHEGTEAPQSCPSCAHPQAYFEALETI